MEALAELLVSFSTQIPQEDASMVQRDENLKNTLQSTCPCSKPLTPILIMQRRRFSKDRCDQDDSVQIRQERGTAAAESKAKRNLKSSLEKSIKRESWVLEEIGNSVLKLVKI